MTIPNFFCDIDALNCILGMEFRNDYKDIELTMDLIELPYYFIFTADAKTWTVKAMQRGEIYQHNDSGIEKGSVVVNKESGEGQVKANRELGENMGAFFAACRNISMYIQDKGLESVFADFDPEEKGIMLYVEGDELKYKVVEGKERPDMMCSTLFGGNIMGRPYMDDFMERSKRELMSLEEKIEAAEDGDEDCMQELAMLYLNGDEDEDVEPDPVKALYWFEKSAEEGNASSAFNVGLFYAKGYGTVRDLEKAAVWMEKAAEEGDEDAEALAPKYRQALADIAAAEKGDAVAQGRLAGFYMSMAGSLEQAGTGDYYEESLKWAQKAAEQGDGEGLWTLALAYEHGRGVAKNVDIALEYYEQGAEIGHARSLNSLGCYYIRGDAVEKNMKFGFEMVLRASLLGDGEAMANLGRCYQFGNGCMGNMKKAIVWYKKSLELIPNEELEQKTMIFEMMPDIGEEEDYYGEDSDRELTTEEQEFIDKIDATLPKEVKEIAHNPDVVFVGISFEGTDEGSEDDEVSNGELREAEEADRKAAEERRRQEAEARRKAEEEARRKAEEERKKREEALKKYNEEHDAWQSQCDVLRATRDTFITDRLVEEKRTIEEQVEKEKESAISLAQSIISDQSKRKDDAERTLASLGMFKFGEKKNQKAIIEEAGNRIREAQSAISKAEELYKSKIASAEADAKKKEGTFRKAAEKLYPFPTEPSKPF